MAVTIYLVKQRAARGATGTNKTGVEGDNHSGRFESLFQEYWNRIFNLLFKLVGDRDDAEDLALEVFWRLYKRPPRDRDNLGGWLYRVATRLGYNAVRDRNRRRRYEEQAGRAFIEGNSPANPAVEIEQAEERALVRRVLSKMKPRYAQALALRHSGLSYQEIAGALGVSPGSIGTMLARAESDFEKKYKNETPDRFNT